MYEILTLNSGCQDLWSQVTTLFIENLLTCPSRLQNSIYQACNVVVTSQTLFEPLKLTVKRLFFLIGGTVEHI